MLQGYFDSSGTKSQPFVSLAGFVADVSDWTTFSEEWNAALERHHIEVFKMQIESKRKPLAKRNDRVAEFVAIIRKHALFKIKSSISVPDFRESVSRAVAIHEERLHSISPLVATLADQFLDDIHYWLIENLVMALTVGLWDGGFREPFDMFFDKQIIEMCPGAPVMYGISKSIMAPHFRRMLPDQLISRDDAAFRPLQAADLFAWATRRRHERNIETWEWLFEELNNVKTISCRFIDSKSLRRQVSAFYGYVLGRTPRFNQSLIDQWSKLIPIR